MNSFEHPDKFVKRHLGPREEDIADIHLFQLKYAVQSAVADWLLVFAKS